MPALLQQTGIAWPQSERFVDGVERLWIAFERVQNIREVRPHVRNAGIGLQRGAHQPKGFAELPAFRFHQPEQVQSVETPGRRFEHACVDFFGVAQAALPMQRKRLLQSLAGIERAGLHPGAIAWRRGRVNQRSER